MLSVIHRLFVPHHTNNYRSKILHHKSLFALLLISIIFSSFIFITRQTKPEVLGVASDITVTDLLSDTNKMRQEAGVAPLTLSPLLSTIANAKGTNMFEKNYWAHNAPDGTTPWFFYQQAGYNYLYAGENLARDFNTSDGVVEAWMNSPSHKENLLNPKYKEVGFAVINGTLTGTETTLVVQEFGTTSESAPQTKTADSQKPATIASVPTATPTIAPIPTIAVVTSPQPAVKSNTTTPTSLVAGATNAPLINSTIVTSRVAMATVAVLLIAFMLDLAYIERKKLFRLVGHNLDHIIFLTIILILLLLFGKGVVL